MANVRRWWGVILGAVLVKMSIMAVKSQSSEVWELPVVLRRAWIPLSIIGLILVLAAAVRRGLTAYLHEMGLLDSPDRYAQSAAATLDNAKPVGLAGGWASTFSLVQIARPRTGVPGLVAFGVGAALAAASSPDGAAPAAPALQFIVGGMISYLLCVTANFGNTLSDLAEDSINVPYRVRLAAALGNKLKYATIGSYVVIPTLGLLVGLRFAVVAGLFTLMMSQYSGRPLCLKRHPLGSLMLFAGVVGGPVLLGWLVAGTGAWTPFSGSLLVILMIWFGVFGTAKNVQDYDGDRAAGITTSATIFRSRKEAAVLAAALQGMVFVLWAGLCYIGAFPASFWPVLAWALPVFANGWITARHHADVATLQQIQSWFFLYPMGLLVHILFLLDRSAVAWWIVAAGGLILILSDALKLDARRIPFRHVG